MRARHYTYTHWSIRVCLPAIGWSKVHLLKLVGKGLGVIRGGNISLKEGNWPWKHAGPVALDHLPVGSRALEKAFNPGEDLLWKSYLLLLHLLQNIADLRGAPAYLTSRMRAIAPYPPHSLAVAQNAPAPHFHQHLSVR